MTDERQGHVLTDAAAILRGDPFRWRVAVDFPGVLSVTFENGDGTDRVYLTGFANATCTVDYYADSAMLERGDPPTDGGDTRLLDVEADGYRLAIQFAAVIDRMEH